VMRIGMVLSVTYNIPLSQVAAADLRKDGDGSGDICLRLTDGQRIAYPHLWPHARPWRLARPEPSMRCLPDVAGVASLLSQAWSVAQQQPARALTAEASRGAAAGRGDVFAGAGSA